MTLVQIIASPDFADAVQKLLPPPSSRLCRLEVGQPPASGSVIVIHANTKISASHPEIHDACDAAAWLRREGHTNPIVWLAHETPRLVAAEKDAIINTVAEMEGGKIKLPWFAPLYDITLRLPDQNAQLPAAIETARQRICKRQSLVEAAIARALQSHLESVGVREDHLWKNFESVLRFLRGAQGEWMIHPDDAKAVLAEIRTQVDADEVLSESLGSDAATLLVQQEKRWGGYAKAFIRCGKVKTFHSYKAAGLPYRLLLVDDQHKRLGWKVLLERLLAPYGFAVESDDGQNFETLKDKLKAPPAYDVLLLDVSLTPPKSGKDTDKEDSRGLDALEDIRREKLVPQTPIILFTGYERLELERRRQDLELLGYIVKEEQTDSKQNAVSYYRRLVDLCQCAVVHEVRALMLEWLDDWKAKAPKLHRVSGARLASAIMELDDPLVSSHQAGLAGEAAFKSFVKIKDDKIERDASYKDRTQSNEWQSLLQSDIKSGCSFETPYFRWSSLMNTLRNSAAHPDQSGSDEHERLDATFMNALTVFILHLLGKRPDRWNHDDLRVDLVTLILRRCADELECLHQLFHYVWGAVPTLAAAMSSAPEVIATLREVAVTLCETQVVYNPFDTLERQTRDKEQWESAQEAHQKMRDLSRNLLVETAKLFRTVTVTPPVLNLAASGHGQLRLSVMGNAAEGSWKVCCADGSVTLDASRIGDNVLDVKAPDKMASTCIEIEWRPDNGSSAFKAKVPLEIEENGVWSEQKNCTIVTEDDGSFTWPLPIRPSVTVTNVDPVAGKTENIDGLSGAENDGIPCLMGNLVGDAGKFSLQGSTSWGVTSQLNVIVKKPIPLEDKGQEYEAAVVLRQIILDFAATSKPARPGFGGMGLGARVYLSENLLDVTSCLHKTADGGLDHDHLSLCLLALTRLSQWLIVSVIHHSNKVTTEHLQEVAGTNPSIEDAINKVAGDPYLSPAFQEWLLQKLLKQAVDLLLTPDLDRLQAERKGRKDEEDTARDLLRRLDNKIRQGDDDIRRHREQLVKATRNYEEYGKKIEEGGHSSADLAILEKRFLDVGTVCAASKAAINSLEPQQEELRKERDKQQAMVDSLEKDRNRQDHQLRLHDELGRIDALKIIDTADFEPLLLSIVAGNTRTATALGQTAIALECVKKWAWTDEREDLPGLLSELEHQWKDMASG
jgi:CheY-like chemotaxis protein